MKVHQEGSSWGYLYFERLGSGGAAGLPPEMLAGHHVAGVFHIAAYDVCLSLHSELKACIIDISS